MQLDMHYYGTYAMARTAGLLPRVCKTIATAAQFVDDNAADRHIEFEDGGRIDAQATAHHVGSIIENLDAEDQRQVWVPFHFLPGNEGSSFLERLVCRKDSTIARQMISHHLGYAEQPVGAYLIGVAAHVYADTFSHHGFSGISSDRNKVDDKTIEFADGWEPQLANYLKTKKSRFFRRFGRWIARGKSLVAETVSAALGHGAVATYPDRPYLRWKFRYEYPRHVRADRENPEDFLDGCRSLHKTFTRFGKANPLLSDGNGAKFADIRKQVGGILAFEGKKVERVDKWRTAARTGLLGIRAFTIPIYNEKTWAQQADRLSGGRSSKVAMKSDLYRFYQAASIHRQYVLRELLPKHNLVVA